MMEIKSIADLAIYGAYTEASNIAVKLKLHSFLSRTDAATGIMDGYNARYLIANLSPYLFKDFDHADKYHDFGYHKKLNSYEKYLLLRDANLDSFIDGIDAMITEIKKMKQTAKTGTSLFELSVIHDFMKEIRQETKNLISEMGITDQEQDLEY